MVRGRTQDGRIRWTPNSLMRSAGKALMGPAVDVKAVIGTLPRAMGNARIASATVYRTWVVLEIVLLRKRVF